VATTGAPSETSLLLQPLLVALREHSGLEEGQTLDDPEGTQACLSALRRALKQSPRTAASASPPPRRVAVAMALAVHSQPLLCTTLQQRADDGTRGVDERSRANSEEAFVAPNDVLEDVLGLPEWELDELRNDIDRRASETLKQQRCLDYLWTHFELPNGNIDLLFRVLFPGALRTRSRPDFLRRNTQLYAVVEQRSPPPVLSLYLPWIPGDLHAPLHPLTTFNQRSIDIGFRRSLGRSIGADDEQVDTLLRRLVTIVPRDRVAHYLEADQWRSSGLAGLSGLAAEYGSANWLTRPLQPHEAEWTRWLTATDGTLTIQGEPRALLDALVMPRVQIMMQQLYAALIASIDEEEPTHEPTLADLPFYDLGRHLRAVIAPLLTWAGANATHLHIATNLGIELESVTETMGKVSETWAAQAERAWYGGPTPTRRHSIQTVLTLHLIAVHSSLRSMLNRVPDLRSPHRSLLLLFTAHYFNETRVERLWLKGLSDSIVDDTATLPPPEDIMGTWFWCTWQRLLDHMDATSDPSLS
jgi:hypothetical protein